MIKMLRFFKQNSKHWVLLFLLGSFSIFELQAQSTTSLISGNVNDGQESISDAIVVAVHIPTNTAFYAITNAKGNYILNNVIAGGPYTIKVEKMGYQTTMVQNIFAPIAESVVANIVAEKSTTTLSVVTIYGDAEGSGMNIQRSGIGTRIDSKAMDAMPSVERSLNDVLKLTPQAAVVGGGLSLGGGNYRGSAICVDGASFNNGFGIGSNLPAGGAPISLDAIDQINVNLTPFNVRQSGFQGGAVNMVTKRGTNTWHGSVYDYFTCDKLQGRRVDTNMLTSSSSLNNVTGLTLGGPIVKDKLFFFVNGEYIVDNQAGSSIQARPDEEQAFGGSTGYNRPTVSQMENIRQFLNDQFGYDPGRYQNYSIHTPDYKLLARLDWHINKNNILNVRISHTHTSTANSASSSMSPLGSTNTPFVINGNTYMVNRYSFGRSSDYALPFESANFSQIMNFTSMAAELNTHLLQGKGNNMARLTWSYQNEPRGYVGGLFPSVDILEPYTDEFGNQQYAFYTSFGPDPYTYENLRLVSMLTATDEFTYNTGIHNILAGAQLEWNKVVNGFMQGGAGWYIYDSWQSFVNDATTGSTSPVAFMVTHANADDPTVTNNPTFHLLTSSLYAQDEMEFSKFFKLTVGLRLEMPLIRPAYDNRNLEFDEVAAANLESSFGGLSTATLPKATVNVSPRVGFNWDLAKNRKVVLRGGTGLFTGRIPNVWLVSSFSNSNCLQYQVISRESPDVHFNPNRAEIINGIYGAQPFVRQNLPAPTGATIFDEHLKMPTSWKTSLSLDLKIPGDVKATIEGVYSLNFNEVMVKTLGVKEDGVIQLPGEPDVRTHYTNENVTNSVGGRMGGYYLYNEKEHRGQYFSLSAQLQKTFRFGLDLLAAYTFSHATSLSDALDDQVANASYIYNVNDANAPELGYAAFVPPHRVIASVGYHIQEGAKTATKLGLFYEGLNVGAYNYKFTSRTSYLMNNVSGLGSTSQLMYIPTEEELNAMPFVSDENRAAFADYIAGDRYLSHHRGEYSKRNARLSPWLNRINFRLSQEIYFNVSGQKHTLDVGLDLNNLGNLFCSKWGTYKALNNDQVLNFKDGVYTFTQSEWSTYNNLASTWQILIHVRYAF